MAGSRPGSRLPLETEGAVSQLRLRKRGKHVAIASYVKMRQSLEPGLKAGGDRRRASFSPS